MVATFMETTNMYDGNHTPEQFLCNPYALQVVWPPFQQFKI